MAIFLYFLGNIETTELETKALTYRYDIISKYNLFTYDIYI